MNIVTDIHVEEDFLSGLYAAYSLLSKINLSSDTCDIVSFSKHTFTTPLLEAVLLAKVNEENRDKQVSIRSDLTYHRTIHFDDGGLDTQDIVDLDQFLEGYRDKTYFPILKISASDQNSRERFSSIGSVVYGYLEHRQSLYE